mmetsp:Transcript_16942/g.48663  ORF Transcript_16942/g.48663 Transcript_16942/m.48663 type:complete len:251 (+) Transcript_16942:3250-4002(+)
MDPSLAAVPMRLLSRFFIEGLGALCRPSGGKSTSNLLNLVFDDVGVVGDGKSVPSTRSLDGGKRNLSIRWKRDGRDLPPLLVSLKTLAELLFGPSPVFANQFATSGYRAPGCAGGIFSGSSSCAISANNIAPNPSPSSRKSGSGTTCAVLSVSGGGDESLADADVRLFDAGVSALASASFVERLNSSSSSAVAATSSKFGADVELKLTSAPNPSPSAISAKYSPASPAAAARDCPDISGRLDVTSSFGSS